MADTPCIPPFCTFQCFELDGFHDGFHDLNLTFSPKLFSFELEPGTYVYPIGFAVPEEALVPCLPEKYWATTVDDGSLFISSPDHYKFSFYQESEYRRQYRHAYFGITRKKFGYDCMRHYEIIANGAIPLYVGIDSVPDFAIPFLPRELLWRAWSLLGNRSIRSLHSKHFRFGHHEIMKYYELLSETMTYARRHLTTKAMAKYVLETVHVWKETESCTQKILFLSGFPAQDYQSNMILHGLKKLCPEVVDFPRVDHMYGPNPRIRPDPTSNDWQKKKGGLYGHGFTYAMTLDFDLGNVDRSDIQLKILKHHFDLVIFGGMPRNAMFFEEVRASYRPHEIIFIDGDDWYSRDPMDLARAGFLFRRELLE